MPRPPQTQLVPNPVDRRSLLLFSVPTIVRPFEVWQAVDSQKAALLETFFFKLLKGICAWSPLVCL